MSDGRTLRRAALATLAAAALALAAPVSALAASSAAGPVVKGEFVSKVENGHLAFTGYQDWLVASLGAGLVGAGVVLRRRVV